MPLRRVIWSGAFALLLVAGFVVGLVTPHSLVGASGWSLVVGGTLWGYGGAVRRALRVGLGVGEQLLAGTMVWIAITGVLLALGICSSLPLLGLTALGLALGVAELVAYARAPVGDTTPRDDRFAFVVLALVLFAFLAFNLFGMIGNRANPYDDQVAYVGMVKRLLDVGDLAEPFSFRRLSAYGGQTTLQALAAVRGDVTSIDLLDRGVFQVIGVLLTLDLMRRRQLHLGVIVAILGFLLSLPDLALNSAAIWTGYTCFLGAYTFAAREDLPADRALVLAAGACGVACTLRQNYLLPAGIFTLGVVVAHVRDVARTSSWRAAWRSERRIALVAVAVAGAIVLPYMIAAFRACGTFLYPILLGSGNPVAPLRPTGGTLYDEGAFFINILFNTDPIRVWWLFAPLMLVVKDTRARRPYPVLAIAAAIGFVALVHSFMLSDNWNLWRYAFAYLTPLAVIFLVEVCAKLPMIERKDPPPVRASPAVTVLALLAVFVQFAAARTFQSTRLVTSLQNMHAADELGSQKYDPRADAIPDLQRAIPAGAALVVMIDDPWRLDFARNPISNLDLVGFAAPAPGLPSFTDAEHWRAYFAAQGIRYALFSEAEQSTWMYRRGGWVWRMFSDDELYRFIAAHIVDATDAFAQLARTSKVLAHRDGMIAIDLGERIAPEAPRGPPELERMDRFTRQISERGLGNKMWQLASRSDVVFRPDGLGPSNVMPVPGIAPEYEGVVGALIGTLENAPKRWLSDRTLVRVHGDGEPRTLHVKLWLKRSRLQTAATASVYISGARVATAQPDTDGYLTIDVPASCRGWCDIYLTLSTISDWWIVADSLRAAALLELEWRR